MNAANARPSEGFAEPSSDFADDDRIEPGVLSKKETIDLVRAYYNLKEEPRKRLLDLAKTMAEVA